MALPLLMAGINAVGAGVNAYQNEENRKRQVAGLKSLRNTTPSERKYMARRREIIEGGDPILNQEFQQNIGAVRQQGQFNRQRAQGNIIGQGLEGSIVAQELRRKVDKDVLSSVAGQARELAVRNAKARQQAELDIENMQLRIGDRGADANRQIAQIGAFDKAGAIANIAMAGLSGYTSAGGDFGIKPQVESSAFFNQLSGLDDSAFESLMGDADSLAQFKEGLDGSQLLDFNKFLGFKKAEQAGAPIRPTVPVDSGYGTGDMSNIVVGQETGFPQINPARSPIATKPNIPVDQGYGGYSVPPLSNQLPGGNPNFPEFSQWGSPISPKPKIPVDSGFGGYDVAPLSNQLPGGNPGFTSYGQWGQPVRVPYNNDPRFGRSSYSPSVWQMLAKKRRGR